MSVIPGFAYVQVRLQSRHGERPDEALWQQLRGTSDFAHYLQLARHTPLRHWVETLDPGQGSDEIENELRRVFRRHVDEVAAWVMPVWRPAVLWVRRLPDLPALQHLFGSEPVPVWILNDPEFHDMGCLPPDARLDALRQSECAVFFSAWQAGESLPDAWLAHWRALWPKAAQHDQGIEALGRALHQYLRVQQADTSGSVQARFEALQSQLLTAFRRYSFQPAAVFSYLGLSVLEMVRLRGELLVRQLFATNLEQVA